MKDYKVTNESNYPKSVGGVMLSPGESEQISLSAEEVENALQGLVFEETSKKTQDEKGQESKPDEKEEDDEVNN